MICEVPHLNNPPLIEARGCKEVCQELTQLFGSQRFILLDGDAEPDFRLWRRTIAALELVYVKWNGLSHLQWLQPKSFYGVVYPFEGNITFQISHPVRNLALSPTRGAVLNPGQSLSVRSQGQGQGLGLWIKRESVEQELRQLLDISTITSTVFQSELDFSTEFSRCFRLWMRFLWEEAERPEPESGNPQRLEQTIISSLLQGQPHSYSQVLWQRPEAGKPYQYVHVAKQFILANTKNAITLGDIAAAVGVSKRVLEKAFSQYCHCSPLQFLRQARLYRIREDLCKAPPGTSVTEVMERYNFTQGGKFARGYRQLFGELPSETLKHPRSGCPDSLIPSVRSCWSCAHKITS